MKKVLAIFAMAGLLVACNSSGDKKAEDKTDTAAKMVDTAAKMVDTAAKMVDSAAKMVDTTHH